MSILARIYKHTLGRVLPQPSHTVVNKEQPSKKRKHDESDGSGYQHEHKKQEQENGVITKKRRVTEAHFAPIVNGQEFESTLIAAPSVTTTTAHSANKVLMPPPAISLGKNIADDRTIDTDARRDSMDIDSASQISHSTKLSLAQTQNEASVDYDMEKARRHAAATALPENSGIWEESEKELFFHFSLRGFEPLLPHNWMSDFRTLPLSLYQSDDENPALIKAYRQHGEFRAIRELRDLLDLGINVRDRVLAAPGVKREDIIDRAMKKYIKWALYDAGLKVNAVRSRRKPMPIYVQVKRKSQQTIVQCLAELKSKMHVLRAQHFRARNIHESIERDAADAASPDSEGVTQVADSSDDDLPVIYGTMISSSVLTVFTLNSRVPSPRNATPLTKDRSPRTSKEESTSTSVVSREAHSPFGGTQLPSAGEEDLEDDPASDPRFFSDFDFSDHRRDVWNTFVVAILAMQIRKDMLALRDGTSDEVEDICAGIETSSVMEDDPDA